MNITYFLFFICIVVCTLIITYWAAKKSNTTSQFYTAAGSLTGTQNGLAIAGDYISAASFLGIIGAIALYGYDGFLYSIGFLVSYLIVLLLVAEPIHHLGKFSLGDVICARFPSTKMRWMMAVSSFIISILYLIPQLVAAGLLIRLLLDINYTASVLVIGSLMTIYVAFGGMLATSWVQIIKTIVLLGGVFLLSLIVFSRIQWNISDLIQRVEEGTVWGEKYFLAGQLFDSPIEDHFTIPCFNFRYGRTAPYSYSYVYRPRYNGSAAFHFNRNMDNRQLLFHDIDYRLRGCRIHRLSAAV